MSNRLLAIFILVVIFGGIFGAYWYFFVANVGAIELSVGSLTGVTVEITTPFQYSNTTQCSTTCLINRVPPVGITLTAKKEGYDAKTENFTLTRGEKKNLTIVLQKTIILESKDSAKSDKIDFIKLKKNISEDVMSGSITPLGIYNNNGYAYSTSSGFALFYYDENNSEKIVAELPTRFPEISWNGFDGIILLKNENGEAGFLDIDSGTYTALKEVSGVSYVKKGPKENYIIVRAVDGVYLLDKSTGTVSKDGIYDDYIVLASGKILGLLTLRSTSKMSLLNLPTDGKAKIVLQDIATHERRVVYSTSDDIIGLVLNAGKIYAMDSSGKSSEVKNLEF